MLPEKAGFIVEFGQEQDLTLCPISSPAKGLPKKWSGSASEVRLELCHEI